jgi:hypothetical protein
MTETRERLENAFAKRYYAAGEEDVWGAVAALIAAAEEMIPAPGMVILDPDALPGGVDYLRGLARMAKAERAVILNHLADLIEAQTAPVVAEPLGLGAVVRDGVGLVWVRRSDVHFVTPMSPNAASTWGELDRPVTVLSQGWTEEA